MVHWYRNFKDVLVKPPLNLVKNDIHMKLCMGMFPYTVLNRLFRYMKLRGETRWGKELKSIWFKEPYIVDVDKKKNNTPFAHRTSTPVFCYCVFS